MKPVRKALENIRTISSMVNSSKPMTSLGALMERARLGREKERLGDEVDRLERRLAVIQNRLTEIEKFERYLEQFTESPSGTKERQSTKAKCGGREITLRY